MKLTGKEPKCFGIAEADLKDSKPCRDCKWIEDCYDASQTKGPSNSPLTSQVGGSHYKDMPIQPVEFIHKNGIGFVEGAAIKYLCRWRSKNGIEDLKKAKHFIELLIEMEEE